MKVGLGYGASGVGATLVGEVRLPNELLLDVDGCRDEPARPAVGEDRQHQRHITLRPVPACANNPS